MTGERIEVEPWNETWRALRWPLIAVAALMVILLISGWGDPGFPTRTTVTTLPAKSVPNPPYAP